MNDDEYFIDTYNRDGVELSEFCNKAVAQPSKKDSDSGVRINPLSKFSGQPHMGWVEFY